MTLHSKKSVIDIGPVQLIGIILAIVLIVSTSWFFARLSGIVTGGGAERATDVSFQTLALTINNLLARPQTCSATQDGQNIFVGAEYTIVGFNRELRGGQPAQVNGCESEMVLKPQRPDCPDAKSCLCLYKTQRYFKDIQPMQCIPFDIDYFLMPHYQENNVDESIYKNMIGHNLLPVLGNSIMPTNLFIFGHCTSWWVGKDFGTKRVYIEKGMTGQDKKYILVAYHDQSMEDRYAKCT